MVCDRYELSDRAGAAVASAALKAFGIITEEDNRYVVDRSKLLRERQKHREEIRQKEEELFELVDSIFIDGRKDATLTMDEEFGKYYRKAAIEEHYVIVGEPSSFYLSHVTPEDGTGNNVAKSIYAAIKDTPLEQNLKIVGSDGTAVMTGKHNGCIASLEALMGRSFQWVICLLHLNELPLRHVFQTLDGVTTGPHSFSGPIGKKLNGDVSEWKVVKFKSIPNPKFPVLPNSVMDDLSSDQHYAYRICSAVMLGSVDNGLKLLQVGVLNHSRWLTLGCRILRFYVSQEKPSSAISTLVEFLIKVYFPSWFQIKSKNKITDGSVNFFNIVERVMKLPKKNVRDVAIKVLQRNAYFAHHENVLLAMLGDDDESVRLVAVNKILRIREEYDISSEKFDDELQDLSFDEEVNISPIRRFIIPKINIHAKTYYRLSSLNLKDMQEPPALKGLVNMEIEDFRQNKLTMEHPCHNQAVERHVKLVTEASAAVIGFERRDGFIRQKIRSRKLMKAFNTKKQFNV